MCDLLFGERIVYFETTLDKKNFVTHIPYLRLSHATHAQIDKIYSINIYTNILMYVLVEVILEALN